MDENTLSKLLRKHRSRISEDLVNFDALIAKLFDKKLINLPDRQKIETEKLDFVKHCRLIDYVAERSDLDLETFCRILDSSGNNAIATLISGSVKRENPICYNFLQTVPNFTGRETQLIEIKESLQANSSNIPIKNVVVLSSLGGMGKSEIAKKYIEENIRKDTDIIWIPADNIPKCIDILTEFGKTEYNLSIEPATFGKTIKKIYEHVVFEQRKAIFVFDNIVEYQKEFLPRNCSIHHDALKDAHPIILFTTRTQELIDKVEEIVIDTMTVTEAKTLVKDNIHKRIKKDEAELTELCTTLECFPLAIQQAIGFMNYYWRLRRGYSIKSYLDEFQEKTQVLLERGFKPGQNIHYEFTTAVTWEISLEKIKEDKLGKFAIRILDVCAFLAPDNIPVELVLYLAAENEDQPVPEEAAHLPFDFSMYQLDDSFIRIHSLTQTIIRNRLKKDCQTEDPNSNPYEKLLGDLLKKMDTNDENSMKGCLDHFVSVWEHATEFETLKKAYKNIPSKLATLLEMNCQYNEGEMLSRKAMEKLAKVLQKDNDALLSLQKRNGHLKFTLGDYEGAIEILSTVIENQVDRKEENVELSICIGKAYLRTRQYIKSQNTFENAFEEARSCLDSEGETTLVVLLNLAHSLTCLGRFKEAENIYGQLQKVSEKLSPENQLQLTIDYADNQRHLGHLEEAGKYYKDAIDKLESSDSDVKYKVYTKLGKTYRLLGKFEEAESILNGIRCQYDLCSAFPKPKTLSVEEEMGKLYMYKGEYNKAKEIFDKVGYIKWKCYADSDPDIQKTFTNIAKLKGKQNQYSEALTDYEKVESKLIEIISNQEGKNPLLTWQLSKIQFSIAEMNFQLKLYSKAVEKFDLLLKMFKETVGEHHPYTLQAMEFIIKSKSLLRQN